MIIILFGISNVGKTSTGRRMAEKLSYSFYDVDEEIRKRYAATIDQFMEDYPYREMRDKIRGLILKDLTSRCEENMVIASGPIIFPNVFNALLDLEHVLAIELQDSVEHIFERLVFADENDNLYKDDAYKEKHKEYYLRDISEDIFEAEKTYEKIENKYFIDNKSIEKTSEELILKYNLKQKSH